MTEALTADRYVERLFDARSDVELEKIQRYFKTGPGEYGEGDQFIGVRMGALFDLSKEFIDMAPAEIEKLLESPFHEVRAGGLSIMRQQAARKRTPDSRRKELFDLYLRRTDRINNWDLVDVSCMHVLGSYLIDKPRDVLYELAQSANIWERRTAVVTTLWFVRKGETNDAFAISELLLGDSHDLIHKAVGWALRSAGDIDRPRLLAFLDQHAATMPRTALRYAMEKFDKPLRDHYLGLKKAEQTSSE